MKAIYFYASCNESSFNASIIEAYSKSQIRERGLHLFQYNERFNSYEEAIDYLLSQGCGMVSIRIFSLV